MARKPDIQYIGQFYMHGSEAKKLAPKPVKEPKEYSIPLHRFQQVQKIYVDPLAIVSLVVAVVLLAAMVVGSMQLQKAWQELDTASRYLNHVENVHTARLLEYHSGYNLKDVRETALNMGLVPVSELPVVAVTVTVPEPEAELTQWDHFVWFMKGLFA